MEKKLSEMTLAELWQLFPIFLAPHQSCWQGWFCEEKAALQTLLPAACRIEHIGSTAVSTIWAKPIIDILIEMPSEAALAGGRERLARGGYLCMSQGAGRCSFNKGYTEHGFAERVFHLHLRLLGDNDELYFRDLLLECPAVAREYEAVKLALWKEYEHDRDAYTRAKTAFVQKYTQQAKLRYQNRYAAV